MTGSFPVIEYVPTRLSNDIWDSIQYKDGVLAVQETHDDVIKWKHFPRYWPFVRGIHRSPVNSPHKVQWRGALMFSLICVWIKSWVNNRKTGDLRRYRAHHDVIVMIRRLSAKIIGPILRLNAGIHIVHLQTEGKCNQRASLTHGGRDTKWPPFRRWHFQTHFLEWKLLNFK